MIAVDTNLLVFAHRAESDWHAAAAARLRDLAEGRVPWAIPWSCLHEFFAIVTHPRIYDPPTPSAKALEQIEAWLESPTLVLLSEGHDHWPILRRLVATGKLAGPIVHDARVAAVCLSHAVDELWSADRDFSRFAGLATRNPLLGAPSG